MRTQHSTQKVVVNDRTTERANYEYTTSSIRDWRTIGVTMARSRSRRVNMRAHHTRHPCFPIGCVPIKSRTGSEVKALAPTTTEAQNLFCIFSSTWKVVELLSYIFFLCCSKHSLHVESTLLHYIISRSQVIDLLWPRETRRSIDPACLLLLLYIQYNNNSNNKKYHSLALGAMNVIM